MFLHGKEETTRKESIGAGATMEGELWSIFGAEDEEASCAEEACRRTRLLGLKSELLV
jgi:hypothetical protein